MSVLGVPFATSLSISAWIALRDASRPVTSSGSPGCTGMLCRSIHDVIRWPPLHETGCTGASGKE
eukprot:1442927-Prymnesium_polylepis.1